MHEHIIVPIYRCYKIMIPSKFYMLRKTLASSQRVETRNSLPHQLLGSVCPRREARHAFGRARMRLVREQREGGKRRPMSVQRAVAARAERTGINETQHKRILPHDVRQPREDVRRTIQRDFKRVSLSKVQYFFPQ